MKGNHGNYRNKNNQNQSIRKLTTDSCCFDNVSTITGLQTHAVDERVRLQENQMQGLKFQYFMKNLRYLRIPINQRIKVVKLNQGNLKYSKVLRKFTRLEH